VINYVARQPIFDREQKVFAYELLYRSGSVNYFNGPDGTGPRSKWSLENLQKTADKLNLDAGDTVKAYVDALEMANNLYS
jgi:c-di-GMP-related signal transduction protein